MSKKKLKKQIKKLSQAAQGGSFGQQVGGLLLGQVVPKLLEQWGASNEPADLLRAIKPAVFGPTVEASPDDLRVLYLTRKGELEERREEIAARVAELEAKAEEHKHRDKTLDDLSDANRMKVAGLVQAVRLAADEYNRAPAPVSWGGPVLSIDGRAIAAGAIHSAVADQLNAGLKLDRDHVDVLLADLQAFWIKELAPCCEDCADGPGKCSSKLSKARNHLAQVEAEIGYWSWVLPRIPDRRAHLTLAMAARLHGLPPQGFEGL